MNKRKTGNIGEEKTAKWLETNKHYKILERNYTAGVGEIDIIALDGDTLVFIEVKARNGEDFGQPYEAINLNKQKRICKAAITYLGKNQPNPDIKLRFDVSEIINKNGVYYIRYTENAFEWRE